MKVVLIDNKTRLIMPESAWAAQVLDKLTSMGHTVQVTDEDPDSVDRDDAELRRRDVLLDSTRL